jgi:hypothetical protein
MKKGRKGGTVVKTNAGVACISPADFDNEELVANEVAAPLLGLSPLTLTDWRHHKRGPAFFKVGRLVYYRRADLWAWLQAQRREPVAA